MDGDGFIDVNEISSYLNCEVPEATGQKQHPVKKGEAEGQVVIEDYGYELWRYADKIAWYDAQPHIDDVTLASTYPHHKHILPDIKYHRLPAPDMSFTKPNLSALIREIEELLKE